MEALTGGRRRRALAVGLAIGLTVLCVLVMLPFRDDLSEGAPALVLMVPPLIGALAGLWPGLGCALFGALAFNFFFTEPYGSPWIESSSSVVAFVVYLVVAAALAVSVSRLREAAEANRRRTRILEVINGLSEGLLRGPKPAPALRSALHDLLRLVRLEGLALRVDGDDALTLTAGDASRAEAEVARLARGEGGPVMASVGSTGSVRIIPVSGGEGPVGLLAVDTGAAVLGEDDWAVVEGVADVIGLGIARSRLDQERVRREALEETDRLRVALTRSVTHDLRTPVAAIRAAAGALRGVDAPETRRTLIDDIEREAERLTHLVTNMLDLSRIEAGSLQVQPSLVPLADLVDEAVAAVPGSEGRVVSEVPDDLPPVEVDETMVRQVLVNLVQNAVLHAPGSPVEVDAEVADGRIRISVADHGPGIPEAERRRVFEPYRRLRPGGRGPGSGLGLAICRGYVEAHGGTVDISTTPGGGATFTVELPR